MAVQPRLQTQDDERKLIEAVQSDPRLFDRLYEQHVDAIYAYAFNRLRDAAAAEDIVSETFFRAFENLNRFEWRGVPFSAWLYRIASNAVAARFRHDPPAPLEAASDLQDGGPGPEQWLLRGERGRELRAAIACLPPEQQQVVFLRYGQELRNKEIATIMERSEGAVKQLLHRAMQGLQRRLTLQDEAR